MHKHKSFWPVTSSVRGQSPGQVASGQRHRYDPLSPRNINQERGWGPGVHGSESSMED